MVFSSLLFIFIFFAVTLALYYAVPNRVYRNVVLCVLSLLFYGWGEPTYVLLMIFSIMMNYLAGLLVGKFRDRKAICKLVLIISIVINVGLLVVFKYTALFVDTLKSIFPFLRSFATPIIPLPIGISFYTFQAMSYVIDVYRRETAVQKNPVYFGTYVSLFPQLIAGPIVRYRDVADQLEHRHENIDQFISGVKLFSVGLAKKVLVANQLAALWDHLKCVPTTNGIVASWIGIIAFSLQIYFDFSGYSDMAIGLGRMFGFEFLKNFDYPYISKSVSEFWRRWHISLGTWFREYVYIPLGGNRKGLARTLLNLGIVWALTGLWHGASWNFMLWGLYFGVLIILEKLFLGKWLEKIPAFFSHFYLLLLVVLGWLIFDFTNMKELGAYFVTLFKWNSSGLMSHEGFVYTIAYLPVLIVACIGATPLPKKLHARIEEKRWGGWVDIGLILAALVLCTSSLVASGYNPFIYFRF
ncbi:MAG: MBOAT family protein [Clostridia bacterium]|nr:MBOAT family protein [Clostridia bacterium]